MIENEKIRFGEAIIFLDISDVEDESKIYKLDNNGNVISRNLSSEINYNQLGDQKLRVFLYKNTTIFYFASKLIYNLFIKKKR